MSNLVQSLEGLVEAGVKGIMEVLSPTSTNQELPPADGEAEIGTEGNVPPPQPRPLSIPTSSNSNGTAVASTGQGGQIQSKLNLPKQDYLIQVLDVPSGWIHLQSTYLDGEFGQGQKKVRSFSLRNVVDGEVEVEVESDLEGQLVFWLGEEEKATSSSASSTSSSSTSAGSPSLHITLPPSTTLTIFFAFQPTHSVPSTPAIDSSPSQIDDGGYTPRVKPVLSRTHSSEMSPVGVGSPSDGRSSEVSSISGGSVAGSIKGPYSIQASRRPEPVHRAFSVHGSITIRAITSSVSLESVPEIPPAQPNVAHQIVNLPFFATVCRSLFTAAPIDPIQGLVTGSQISSGELVVDFGNNSAVGGTYHRDILLVNRSEIELIWKTTVVSSSYKEAVWFELRDLDSENVFGVDHSSQPVPLPSLSSRHLRLEMRAKSIINDFDFTFLISNVNQSGNVISCKAIGSILPEKSDDSLILLSGTNIDFGQVLDGIWTKQMITCKNNGDKPIDVKFSATKGYNVVFRLAGVAGEDLDEDLPVPMPERERPRASSNATSSVKRSSEAGLSRTSTKDNRGRDLMQQHQQQLRDPRAESPFSSPLQSQRSRPTSSIISSEMFNAYSVPGDFGRPWSNVPQNIDVDSISASASGFSDQEHGSNSLGAAARELHVQSLRDTSQPPSRPLSRVTSRNSSYLLRDEVDGESIEDDDGEEDFEPPFFGGGESSNNRSTTSSVNTVGSAMTMSNPNEPTVIPNQIEEMTMRPGTEYRIYVLHKPDLDDKNPPEVAGKLRKSTFKVYLDSVAVGGQHHSRSTSGNTNANTSANKELSMSSASSSTSATSSTPSTSNAPPPLPPNSRRISINCTIEHCTSLISLPEGRVLNFGKVTVGSSKSLKLKIHNLSELSTKIEIAAISKVISLSSNKNVLVIPPLETIEEKLEFFPRRINEHYEKECFVRNLLNRKNDQVVEIRSQNVDVYNLTLHSHLYRILTPSGSNFLDFGNVVINAPTVRTVHIENLSNTQLILDLYASQPEDIGLYVKAEDEPIQPTKAILNKYSEVDTNLERITSPPNGELKERFMETLQELSEKNANGSANRSKSKVREKSLGKPKKDDGEKDGKSVGQQVAVALKKGGRGRPVQLYGNSVVFKDRTLLESHEYLDLASGPPVCAHRSPRAKRFALLDSIELEDKTKLSGKHDKIPKLDFAAVAKASGLVGKEAKTKKKHPHHNHHHHHHPPGQSQSNVPSEAPSAFQSPGQSGDTSALTSPKSQPATLPQTHDPSPVTVPPASQKPEMHLNLSTLASQVMQRIIPETGGRKSPALTAKRPIDLKMTESSATAASDPSKMSVDELLLAIERHDSLKSSITHSSLEEEEAYVRRAIALKKELQNVISSGKLVPARTVNVGSKKTKAVIVVMTPNGSTRPHVGTRAKRADSRIFIKLVEFDKSLLNEAGRGTCNVTNSDGLMNDKLISKITAELPIRDLIIRSSCVRSVLEVQQSSINFGGCDKGEIKEKTIVIHNKSDTIGLFRLRTSGSIASGDLKLGLGRYGVISAFGRREVPNFSFTPSLVGNYQELITVENVLDGYNDQTVVVKAVVRKIPAFRVEPDNLDFGVVNPEATGTGRQSFILTNISKHEKTFSITLDPSSSLQGCFAQLNLIRDDKDVGLALSKVEEEEVEGILQKLKIAKRKGKAEKIEKYENRLRELGVKDFKSDEPEDAEGEGEKPKDEVAANEETTTSTNNGVAFTTPPSPETIKSPTAPPPIPNSSSITTSLSLTLAPNQKTKILVDLVPHHLNTVTPSGGTAHANSDDVKASITVHDKRNTDETVAIAVKAVRGTPENTHKEYMEKAEKMADRARNTTSDLLALALMQHSLDLTLNCEVSPTAFCVGSTLFLPSSSPHYSTLSSTGKFDSFPSPSEDKESKGLILGDGWSRQIPGNTHAEANALTNFRTKYGELQASFGGWGASSSSTAVNQQAIEPHEGKGLPSIEDVLRDADCYATMEPCSVRTSGGPSCALELVRAGVKAVYLGVEEPPDFVQCEGVRILEDGGVKVIRTSGLEEACLKAARRGRN
ncbi:hypothetical protein I302_107864 [Kwoniella bestiolae CBS 10118]|uniref:CFAP74 fourth Ig-like domain-containing protein n=1 Tax=Kwoniella bestiolae CBS 10118 TaxID=1296100 RepID=A0A1B9FXB9_9TREE|nr:hypothetical protein I302_06394 [Kwoniella bestiolae CBS 10118]OCF23413.1 hypothetical protein I302_06394 [Kwoniella bestiolae CBS 10118]